MATCARLRSYGAGRIWQRRCTPMRCISRCGKHGPTARKALVQPVPIIRALTWLWCGCSTTLESLRMLADWGYLAAIAPCWEASSCETGHDFQVLFARIECVAVGLEEIGSPAATLRTRRLHARRSLLRIRATTGGHCRTKRLGSVSQRRC